MIVTICYFLQSMKLVFILVQCNTSLSKSYAAHSITVVGVIGIISGKDRFVCTLWLSVHMKSVIEQGLSTKFNNKALKTLKFQIY